MKTVILKLGGSVVTYKNRQGLFIRYKNLKLIAQQISHVLVADSDLRLILVHGAGNAGHQAAKKYDLKNGTGNDNQKIRAALEIRTAIQRLNRAIVRELLRQDIKISTVHTASVITQSNGKIDKFDFNAIDESLDFGCVPMMYGEMVFDDVMGMSVCSGDAIVMQLAKKYGADKIIFSSDIDGIYDSDPHINPNANIISIVSLESLTSDVNIKLHGSHNVDVTGGLANKIVELTNYGFTKTLKKVVVCNGLKENVLVKAFSDNEVGTIIEL